MRLQGGVNPQRTKKMQVTAKPQKTAKLQVTGKPTFSTRQINAIKASPKGVLPKFVEKMAKPKQLKPSKNGHNTPFSYGNVPTKTTSPSFKRTYKSYGSKTGL